MTIDDKIRNEKLQYDINREETKILALLSGKIDKCEYLTGEEMLPSNQRQIIEQAKFTYSPLGKALGKQTKTIEDQGIKQVKALKALKSEKELESVEEPPPPHTHTHTKKKKKRRELMKLKMKYMKSKNENKKLNQNTENMKLVNINMIFNNMKQ